LDYYDPAPDDSSIYDPTVVVLKYLVEGTNVHALICIVDAFVNLSFNARSYEDSWYQEEAV
jgi:hypothetical protein